MLRTLPRTLVARYAPQLVKKLLRRTWWQLQRLARGGPRPRLLFAFGGRTEYAPGTGRELYAHEPVFRATVQECERISTQVLGGPSIISNFTGPAEPDFFADEARLILTSAVMQLALVDLWLAQGVQPTAVLGLSLGEVAAVYAAGGLNLADALRVCFCYCAASQVTSPDYAMLVVQADGAVTGRLAATCPVELYVVLALDSSCCLAFCTQTAVSVAQQYLAVHDITSTAPAVRRARPYHSPVLARHLAALRAPMHGLQPQPLALPCYLANAGGHVPIGTVLGIEYWLTLVQHQVDVHGMLGAALADGYSLFLPIGADPFPFLFEPAQRAVLHATQVLPALRPMEPERSTLAACRQQLAARGLVRAAPLPRPAFATSDFVARFVMGTQKTTTDLYPAYAYLRQLGGLHFLPTTQRWLVLDAELVDAVLREPLVFSSAVYGEFDTELIGADPPLHTANRQLLQPFFSLKELADLRDFAAARVAELGAAMLARASFDFVQDFAVPLTQAVSAQLLGLTTAERQRLQSSLPGHVYQVGYVKELNDFLMDYFQQHEPGAAPGMMNQLLTLIRAGRLSQRAAVGLAQTMWMASITTTSMLMSNAAQYLLTHPAVAAELRADPELVGAFAEEILRLEPPVEVERRTTRPATLGGQTIPAGAIVVCSVAAANRDPARHPNPDVLDLHRRPGRHLSFGGGIHACMGAHLARLEARIVIHWLLAQGPALRRVNASAAPTYFQGPHFRDLATLPLTLQPLPAA